MTFKHMWRCRGDNRGMMEEKNNMKRKDGL